MTSALLKFAATKHNWIKETLKNPSLGATELILTPHQVHQE